MTHDTVTVGNLSMSYCTFGSGERTLVILPGVSLDKVSGQVQSLAQQYALFAEDFTTYLFDRKNNFEAPYSVEDMAEDTARAMQALGLGPSYVMGMSQGGSIAQVLALQHPELVKKLALVSTASRPNDTMRTTVSQWIQLAEAGDFDLLVRAMVPQFFTDEFVEKNNLIQLFLDNLPTQEGFRRFITMCEAQLLFDVYDRLDQINKPVLVLGAGDDTVVTAEASREIAQRTGAELCIFENYRHAVYDELGQHRPLSYEFFTRGE